MKKVTVPDNTCMYKNESDAICKHLSNIVTDRDTTMLREFDAQNAIIREHNTEVINLLKAQHSLIREIRLDVEKHEIRIKDLESKDKTNEKKLELLVKYAGFQETAVRILLAVTISVIVLIAIHRLFF